MIPGMEEAIDPEEAEKFRQSLVAAGLTKEDARICFDMFLGIKHEMVDILNEGSKKAPPHLIFLIRAMILDALQGLLNRPDMRIGILIQTGMALEVASKRIPVPPDWKG
jgi:hypothetical protein